MGRGKRAREGGDAALPGVNIDICILLSCVFVCAEWEFSFID